MNAAISTLLVEAWNGVTLSQMKESEDSRDVHNVMFVATEAAAATEAVGVVAFLSVRAFASARNIAIPAKAKASTASMSSCMDNAAMAIYKFLHGNHFLFLKSKSNKINQNV